MSEFLKKEKEDFESEKDEDASKYLSSFISDDVQVGDLLSLSYNDATILVHDSLRQQAGGLPMGCFLLASRLKPNNAIDPQMEDAALIFMRVISGAPLANHAQTEAYRLAAGFRAIDTSDDWDAKGKTDEFTLHELRHAGIKCSVLGTFRMQKHGESWKLTFGADISNFYSGQGMKVYKPKDKALKEIVNYTKPTGKRHDLAGNLVEIGRVRYSSSETKEVSNFSVEVGLEPTDLLARRTALFGMSRSGKSNTIKIIASSVFKLRAVDPDKGRVGQLIFDVNGEYSNINPQDAGCLGNVWQETLNAEKRDVEIYGLSNPRKEEDRQMLTINFMGDEPSNWRNRDEVVSAMAPLVAGKGIVNETLLGYDADYVKAFRNTDIGVPLGEWDEGDVTRYRRSVTVYRSLLALAGFDTGNVKPNIKNLFSKNMRKAFSAEYLSSAETLGASQPSWDALASAFSDLAKFVNKKSIHFKNFDNDYMKEKNKSWANDTLRGILALYEYTTGVRKLRDAKEQHSPENKEDYSDKIVKSVRSGKLVIIDGSIGDETLIRYISNRIMGAVFQAQKHDFVNPKIENGDIKPPPDVIVYIEEAHNLLPKKEDLTGLWPRIAKEGSKFRIGMVFSTQEPSSIMSNILKNTDNWFVAHLNNSDEVKELGKYYDFGEFIHQILKVPDTGFLRMRCLSNPYIVPIQVAEFKSTKGNGKE